MNSFKMNKIGEMSNPIELHTVMASLKTMGILGRHYDVGAPLGRGSFGTVFAAKNRGAPYYLLAIKVMDEKTFDDSIWKSSIENEIRILQIVCGHENIVNCYTDMILYDSIRKRCFIVYDRMDLDLYWFHRSILASRRRVHPVLVKRIVYKILRGLRHMHGKNVWHLDVKPSNILISRDGEDVRICDFGMSRVSNAPVIVNELLTTICYRPPELFCRGGQHFTESVDIWSVGCILTELTLGRLTLFPVMDEDMRSLWKRIKSLIGVPDESFLKLFTNPELVHLIRISAPPPFPPEINNFHNFMEDHCADLIRKMLCYTDRISARDAMVHPYFDEVREHVWRHETH